ncbi:MAG: lipid-A-disaccharide synthase [Legionella sp.]|nr:lipid-A-disaccharide synthase [Legionella sp.]
MPLPKRIVIIAGEESGDIHAANMVRELLIKNPTYQITGIGGKHMQEAGVELVSDLARYGVTGLTEVIRHARVIKKAYKAIKAHLELTKPDLLILVDYPGFNLRLAKFAKLKLGLRIVYYISPQIWAWKANRINTIRRCIDKMAVILPFEKNIYELADVPVSFVGHPLVNKIPDYNDVAALRAKLNLPLDKKIVAMLPGSRRNEIERHLPVLVETAAKLSATIENLHFVIPIAETLDPAMITSYFANSKVAISFIQGQAIDVAASSDCVVVASGTASLECALLIKPMCIIYKTSLLTYVAATKLIKVKYLGLCNLLQNELIVPELLQYDCNSDELTIMLMELLTNSEKIERMQLKLQKLKHSLSAEQADSSIAELVNLELQNINPLSCDGSTH